MSTVRRLYRIARLVNNYNAIKRGQAGRHVARRAAGRAVGRGVGRLFK